MISEIAPNDEDSQNEDTEEENPRFLVIHGFELQGGEQKKTCFLFTTTKQSRILALPQVGQIKKMTPKGSSFLFSLSGGSERIRTSGTVARTHAFQACSLNHSDTLPHEKLYQIAGNYSTFSQQDLENA